MTGTNAQPINHYHYLSPEEYSIMTASKLKLITTDVRKKTLMSVRTQGTRTKIANNRHIAAGSIITSQIAANSLPSVDSVTRERETKFF
ncbi:MAG: hypothetical protein QNJ55_23920 [Xenococcus sp. MO_188.B8]|nr:hypothetical protein [Xenococcus sp. MO_188.B8]